MANMRAPEATTSLISAVRIAMCLSRVMIAIPV